VNAARTTPRVARASGAGIRRQLPAKPSRLSRLFLFLVIALLSPIWAAFWVGLKVRGMYGVRGFGR